MNYFFGIYCDQNIIVKKSIEGAQIRILLNYLSTLSIIYNLKINWSDQMIQLITVVDCLSGYVSRIISFECVARRKK